MPPRRSFLGALIFGVGVVASLVFAFYNLKPLIESATAEAEGVTTINTASFELLQYFVPPIIAFWLSRRVRGRGRLARRLRRVHFFTTIGWVVAVGMLSMLMVSHGDTSGLTGIWLVAMFGTLLGGALWMPLQTLFSAAFLAVWVKGTRRMRQSYPPELPSPGH